MDGKEYQFNQIKEDIIVLKEEYKKKGKEYGIVKMAKKQISAFVEAIDLISVSPSISSKFSEKVEKFIFPRFMELNNITYSEKTLPSEVSIELSKENQKNLINALEYSSVIVGLEERGYSIKELREVLKKISFFKEK
ncbi:MAG: hypothetical protein ACFFFB_09900 [Candidatus Heimdallarchaeota archaeon]